MEENNNNENQEKEAQKKRRKNLTKYILKPLIKPLIIISLCLFGIFLTVGLFFAVRLSVLNLFSDLISDYNEENLENGSASANNSVIYIDENTGYYKLKDEYSKKIIQQLEDHKVNTEVMGFVPETEDDEEDEGAAGGAMDEETAKELQDMIDKYIKAEVQTTFPKTGNTWWWQNDNEIDGKIIIKRASSDGNIKYLEYEKYSDFCSLVEGNRPDALNKFSLNPENFKLCIARKNSTTIYYKDGAEINSEGGGITKEELDYQTYLQNYSVPLNFFITLHVIAQDKAFMEEFVEMAIGGDDPEPIVLTYIDTQEQHTTVYDYTGTAEKTVTTTKVIEESDNTGENSDTTTGTEPQTTQNTTTKPIDITNNNVQEYYSDAPEYDKMVTISNFGKLYITKANTWLKTSNKQISEMQTEDNGVGTQENYPIPELPKELSNNTNNTVDENGLVTQSVNTKITINDLKEVINTSSLTRKYTVVDEKNELAIQGFIDLIESYPKVKNNIQTSPSNIFYLLQQNENTQRLEKIMRYVCYVLNDVNYGVTEADLDYLLKDETFISVGGIGGGGIYGGTLAEKIWFALRDAGYSEYAAAGALGNLFCESDNLVANRVQYDSKPRTELGYNDETYTAAVDSGEYTREQFKSDGAGYGLAQWTDPGRKANLYDFAKNDEGTSIGDEETQIKFLIKELAGYNITSWMNSQSPEEAAENFCNTYERPDIYGPGKEALYNKVITQRQNKAREFYEELKGRTPGTFQPNTDGDIRVRGYYTTRGRTFTILNQNYCSDWGGKCNRAAATMIASGYANQDVDTLIKIMDDNYSAIRDNRDPIIPPTSPYFELYGLERIAFWQSTYQTLDVEEYKNTLRDCLQQGGHAAVWLSCGGTYKGESGLIWTSNVHWVPILDYRNTNGKEEIYVADWQHDGWFSFEEFKNGIRGYALIREQQ